MTAIVPTENRRPAHGVRPEIRSVCCPSEQLARYFDTGQALAELQEKGLLDELPAAIEAARAGLQPVDHNRLTDRLTALGMMMAPNRPPAEASVWLREMTRLLGDLPETVLSEVIDELVMTCKFLPTCAEIREKADQLVAERRRVASQIDAMVRHIEDGRPIPPRRAPYVPDSKPAQPPCTPEQARKILEEFGLASRFESSRDDRKYGQAGG